MGRANQIDAAERRREGIARRPDSRLSFDSRLGCNVQSVGAEMILTV